MPRQVRQIGKTGWAHIIFRGINRENLFYDEEDFGRFMSSIARVQRETACEIAAYCLMANHVHLLMYDGNGAYGKIIKKMLVSYSIYFNRKYDRVGHVFQDRFRSEPIDDKRYLLTVARYIYQNPQKAGVCPAGNYPYTFIQTAGILSGYFSTPEELRVYLETGNNDKCLEYNSTRSYTDSEAEEILHALIGNQNPQCLQSYERKLRDEVIQQLKRKGLTVRQISRLTGINRNIVQRA